MAHVWPNPSVHFLRWIICKTSVCSCVIKLQYIKHSNKWNRTEPFYYSLLPIYVLAYAVSNVSNVFEGIQKLPFPVVVCVNIIICYSARYYFKTVSSAGISAPYSVLTSPQFRPVTREAQGSRSPHRKYFVPLRKYVGRCLKVLDIV